MKLLSNQLPATKTNEWALYLQEQGKVLEGIPLIKQRIWIAISTVAGTSALRPFFSSNLLAWQARNMLVAIPNIKKEFATSIKEWVKEVTVKKIPHKAYENGKVVFTIHFDYNGQYDSLDISYKDGVLSFEGGGKLIVEASVPLQETLFTVELQINGSNVTPSPPAEGFTTPEAFVEWAMTNWSEYGTYGYSKTTIILCFDSKYRFATFKTKGLNLLTVSDLEFIDNTNIRIDRIEINGNVDATPKAFDTEETLLSYLNNTYVPANSLQGVFAIIDSALVYTNPEGLQYGFVELSNIAYETETIAFYTITGITDGAIRVALDDLIKGLKAASLWSKLIAVYPMVGGALSTCKYNLKDARDLDAAYRLVFYNSPSVDANGIIWNGINQYANTFVVPSAQSSYKKLSTGYYSLAQVGGTINAQELSAYGDGSVRYEMRIRAGSNTAINIATGSGTHAGSAFVRPSVTGLYIGTRDNSNIYAIYNGSLVDTKATGINTGNNNDSFYLGAVNQTQISEGAGGFTNLKCGFAFLGNELTSAEAITLSGIINAFMTSMSKNTY